MTDPIWWFFLFWLPDFVGKTYGLDLKTYGPPLVAIYLLADVGRIGGGWLSSALIKRGWSVNRGRKTAMLVCAPCVTPIDFAASADNVWVAVALIGLAAAAHPANYPDLRANFAENHRSNDVTPASHPAATRDRPVLFEFGGECRRCGVTERGVRPLGVMGSRH